METLVKASMDGPRDTSEEGPREYCVSFEDEVLHAEEEFEVLYCEWRWRYASTKVEAEARRDVLLHKDVGEDWTLRVNRYRGEGQLICDDAEWEGGIVLGNLSRLSYQEAVRHAIVWLRDDRWDERIGPAIPVRGPSQQAAAPACPFIPIVALRRSGSTKASRK